MSKHAKAVLWGLGGFLVLLLLCVTLLLTFNWNYARPWVARQLGQAIERPVAIQGDLSLHWERPQSNTGWARWIPWPRVVANDIRVENPTWISPGQEMAQAGSLAITLNPLALLNHTVQIANLQLHSVRVLLLRNADNQNNWTPKQEINSTPSRWKFDLQKVDLQDVAVRMQDASSALDLNTELNSLKAATQEGYGIDWKTSGSYRELPVSGQGQSAGVLSLQHGDQPFPLQGDVKIGETTIAIEGSVTRPQTLAALDVQLKLAGNSMADLNTILGVALPGTPPYSTEGHLIGLLNQDEKKWTYEKFKGIVGESDLEGTVHYLMRKPRPLLTGELESSLLSFKDLGPLIGIGTNDPKAPTKEQPRQVAQPLGKALPVAPINTKSWARMDADVTFVGRRILRNKDLPLDNVRAHVKLNDSTLVLDPLTFGVAGGDLAARIELDGKASPIKAKMAISARHLKLRKLIPAAQSMKASLGEVHGDASLSAQGDSIAALLGHSNGEVQALVSKGTISHLLLETAGLNVANIVLVKLFGDEQIVLNCLASDFNVKNGVMTARAFKLDTKDAVVDITGQINLRTERFDLDVRPENKSVRIFTLRTPLYVKGTFKNPDVGVQAKPLAARAGAAVVLGILATPFAAIIPLLNLGTDDSSECAPLLAAVSKQPKAPPPAGVPKAATNQTDKNASSVVTEAPSKKGEARPKKAKSASPMSSMFNTATDAEKRKAAEPNP